MTDTTSMGEGDHEAGREYQKRTKAFVDAGRTEAAAREAAQALSGPEGEALERARQRTMSGASAETIFERLREDHQTQRTLVGLVEKTHGDSKGRRELFERLAREIRAHAEAEERVLYAALLATEMAREKAGHSVHEHKQVEEMLCDLEEKPMDSPGWLPTFRKLEEAVHHHLDEEEHQFFQLAGRALEPATKRRMVAEFEAAKANAKR